MMPSRHRRENENILFPSEEGVAFLFDSAEEKAKVKCLGLGFPFPNITLADMLLFLQMARKMCINNVPNAVN